MRLLNTNMKVRGAGNSSRSTLALPDGVIFRQTMYGTTVKMLLLLNRLGTTGGCPLKLAARKYITVLYTVHHFLFRS